MGSSVDRFRKYIQENPKKWDNDVENHIANELTEIEINT